MIEAWQAKKKESMPENALHKEDLAFWWEAEKVGIGMIGSQRRGIRVKKGTTEIDNALAKPFPGLLTRRGRRRPR